MLFGNRETVRGICCEDDKGRTEWVGRNRFQLAERYQPTGNAKWFVLRPSGEWQLHSEQKKLEAPPPAPVSEAAGMTVRSNLDPVAAALEYGQANARMLATAYRDAFTIAGNSWASVVQPLAQALEALSRRVVTLEQRLEDVPMLEAEPLHPPPPPEKNPLDELAEGVLAGVVQGAMGAGGSKP